MTDEEILARAKEIEGRRVSIKKQREARHDRNEQIYNHIILVDSVKPFIGEPVTLYGEVDEHGGDYGYGQTRYIGEVEDYLDTLPLRAKVKVTVEVTGPVITEPLYYECEYEDHGLKYPVDQGTIKTKRWTIYLDKRTYFCPEHAQAGD